MQAAILFFVVLGVLVFVHELGHFWAARLSGIKVTEFGLGFPPKAYGFKPKNSEVEYSLNWLPIGGFVKIFGEDYESLSKDDPDINRSFTRASKPKQLFVLVAGVVMNLLAAFILFTIASWSGGYTVADDIASRDGFIVASVNPGSPADQAGIKAGHNITSISDGEREITKLDLDNYSFSDVITGAPGEVVITLNNGKQVSIQPQPGLIAGDPDRQAIGVYAESLKFERASFIDGIIAGANQTWQSLQAVTQGFWDLISSAFQGSGKEVLSSLSGPVGIAQLSAQAYNIGIGTLLTFAGFLSINLVILNLLPFPALDGGRIVMVLIESIKGSPINSKVAGYLNLIGFGLLLLLMFVITTQDIIRIL